MCLCIVMGHTVYNFVENLRVKQITTESTVTKINKEWTFRRYGETTIYIYIYIYIYTYTSSRHICPICIVYCSKCSNPYLVYMVIHPYPDSKVHGANMGPTWVLSVPGGSHVDPMDLAIWVCFDVASLPLGLSYDCMIIPRAVKLTRRKLIKSVWRVPNHN